jgi:hypothetical protein
MRPKDGRSAGLFRGTRPPIRVDALGQRVGGGHETGLRQLAKSALDR